MNKQRIIAVDFDGTLFEDAFPSIGRPKWNVINYVKELKAKGDIIILWTCRGGKDLEQAIERCKDVGIEFDYVNENYPGHLALFPNSETRKIFADLYIDDKCFNPKMLSIVSNI